MYNIKGILRGASQVSVAGWDEERMKTRGSASYAICSWVTSPNPSIFWLHQSRRDTCTLKFTHLGEKIARYYSSRFQ